MFAIFCSVTARTEKIISSDLHSLLTQMVNCSIFREKISLLGFMMHLTVFLQGKLLLLIACNPEMILRCLLSRSSTVFHSVTMARAEKKCASDSEPEITKGENSTVY